MKKFTIYFFVTILIVSIIGNIVLGVGCVLLINQTNEFRCALSLEVEDLFVDGTVYIKNEDGSAVIIDCFKVEGGNTIIPKELDGCTVKEIYQSAFFRKALGDVVIPDSVERIFPYAFYNSPLLESIHIGTETRDIGEGAFAYCLSLKNITVSGQNDVYYVDGNCLIKSENNELIAGCANSVIPTNVKTIGPHSFAGQKLIKEITIPDSVIEIRSYAFADCESLETIFIPESVSTMMLAFKNATGLVIYCEAEEKPDGWIDEWQIGAENVHWGVSREEYESIVSK